MSHFTVMVVTDNGTTEEITAALAPFHEYECTGRNDKYVIDVDKTEEAMEQYRAATEVRIKAPDGTLHDRFTPEGSWDHRFSVLDPKRPDYSPDQRIEFVPAGHERVEVPASEVEAACDWISGYYGWPIAGEEDAGEGGYIEIDADRNVVKCIDRTNPNAKWDWWTVGGRWAGELRTKAGDKVDQSRLSDLDIDGIRQVASNEASVFWAGVHRTTNALATPLTWQQCVDLHGENYAAAREQFYAQPAVLALQEDGRLFFDMDRAVKAATMSEKDFCDAAADAALPTFALLIDGDWLEKGEMGWFACVANEKEQGDWNVEFMRHINALPSTKFITVVDCHI